MRVTTALFNVAVSAGAEVPGNQGTMVTLVRPLSSVGRRTLRPRQRGCQGV